MVDTLKAARSLEAKGFSREQAEGIAELLGDVSLGELARSLRVLKVPAATLVLLSAGTLWQASRLHGAVAALQHTLASVDVRMTRIAGQLPLIEATDVSAHAQPGAEP